MKTADLKHYSKNELKRMNQLAVINYCPSCKKYHVADKPRFPLYNLSLCDECKKTYDIVKFMLDT